MKEAYEKEIAELKAAKISAETELGEVKERMLTSESKNKENAAKIAQ